jgi:hypothetical protein
LHAAIFEGRDHVLDDGSLAEKNAGPDEAEGAHEDGDDGRAQCDAEGTRDGGGCDSRRPRARGGGLERGDARRLERRARRGKEN